MSFMIHDAWENVLFCHWKLPEPQAAILQSITPFPLDRYEDENDSEIDGREGSAYIGLVLLTERNVGPGFLRENALVNRLFMRTHHGANIRTYVKPIIPGSTSRASTTPRGNTPGEAIGNESTYPQIESSTYPPPGIYFLSLECDSNVTTYGANLFGIPYKLANMERRYIYHNYMEESFTRSESSVPDQNTSIMGVVTRIDKASDGKGDYQEPRSKEELILETLSRPVGSFIDVEKERLQCEYEFYSMRSNWFYLGGEAHKTIQRVVKSSEVGTSNRRNIPSNFSTSKTASDVSYYCKWKVVKGNQNNKSDTLTSLASKKNDASVIREMMKQTPSHTQTPSDGPSPGDEANGLGSNDRTDKSLKERPSRNLKDMQRRRSSTTGESTANIIASSDNIRGISPPPSSRRIPPPLRQSISEFLVERYHVYTQKYGYFLKGDVEHDVWPLQNVEIEKLEIGMSEKQREKATREVNSEFALLTGTSEVDIGYLDKLSYQDRYLYIVDWISQRNPDHVTFSKGVGPVKFGFLKSIT